jgi:flagellar motor switch protein FliN/FliY
MSPQAGSKSETYRQIWSESLALLLSRMAAVEWHVQTKSQSDSDAAAAVPDGYTAFARIRVAGGAGLAGEQCFSFAAADLAALLGIFLGEEVTLAGELDATQTEGLEELVRQWTGLAASALKPEFGEVSLQVTLEAASQAPTGEATRLQAGDGTRSIAVAMQLDDALVRALEQLDPRPPLESAAPSPSSSLLNLELSSPAVPPRQLERASPQIEELLRQGNLELLMDVELAVMLRFGSRQATLREVLDLATGAVLELDREIQEPVDLVLNGRVIARGEVVVVDGNYGLRVIEVASPQQRVNSL